MLDNQQQGLWSPRKEVSPAPPASAWRHFTDHGVRTGVPHGQLTKLRRNAGRDCPHLKCGEKSEQELEDAEAAVQAKAQRE